MGVLQLFLFSKEKKIDAAISGAIRPTPSVISVKGGRRRRKTEEK
jgi:hypothetical protein